MTEAAPKFCPSCGKPLRAQSRFCDECGAIVGDGAPASAPTSPSAEPPAIQAPTEGYKITLQSVGPNRGRVLMALRQMLGLDPATAQSYAASAPALLAVGVSADLAERLRASLVGSGAAVLVEAPPPPPPPEPEKEREPKPEPARYMEARSRSRRELPAKKGLRTVTGLCLGRTGSYLAYARADGQRLVTAPDFVRFEARTVVPTAVRLAGEGITESFGLEALRDWPRLPDSVFLGFPAELGAEGGQALQAARTFLKALAFRLSEVLGPGSLEAKEGSATVLGVPPDWSKQQGGLLAGAAEEAGFPVALLVPEPAAAVAHHQQLGALRPPRDKEHVLVVDWGGQGLRTSVVERTQDAGLVVIDHQEFPLGGALFDMAIEEWLLAKLSAELTDEDRRALALFSRDFKEQASRSFAEGRAEHVQYCVVPAGAPPTRLSLPKSEMDTIAQDAREQFKGALDWQLERIGFKKEHLDGVLLVGGGSRWYFAREAVRSMLGQVPLQGPRPEEAIPRGLAVYGLSTKWG